MATKFLNRYGDALNEINYDTTQYLTTTGTAAAATKLATARTISLDGDCSGSASFNGTTNITINATVKDDSHNHTIANIDNLQNTLNGKAASNHTHSYLPLSGGVMTGDIQFKTTNQTTTPFKVRDSGTTYGHNVIIGGNGSTLIGAGESITTFPSADTSVLKTEEVMYITSDSTVRIITNCNTIANRKEVKINNNGHIEVPNAVTTKWITGFGKGNAALSTTSNNYYATLNGSTKNGRWCLSSYPTSTDIVYLGYATNSHINAGDPNSMDTQFQFDMSNGNLNVPGDVKINGSSVKAVIDFMNKYSSMLNIIGNNA